MELASIVEISKHPEIINIKQNAENKWKSIDNYITTPAKYQSIEAEIWAELNSTLSPKMPFNHIQKIEPIRIYIDGCFDLMHSGHYNAIR